MTKRPPETDPRAEEALLAPFFAEARSRRDGALPEGLQARLLRDAEAHQLARAMPRRPAARGVMARLADAVAGAGGRMARLLGGAPGVAVVCSAGVAGVWIGLAVPETGQMLGSLGGGDAGSLWAQTAQDIQQDEALLAFLDSF